MLGVSINEDAALNPLPGDYWAEQFCPCFLILYREDDIVHYVSERVFYSNGMWAWDYSKVSKIPVSEFKEKVSTKVNGKTMYWCDVSQGEHHRDLAFYEELLKNEKTDNS